jgi:hypothetical protein
VGRWILVAGNLRFLPEAPTRYPIALDLFWMSSLPQEERTSRHMEGIQAWRAACRQGEKHLRLAVVVWRALRAFRYSRSVLVLKGSRDVRRDELS